MAIVLAALLMAGCALAPSDDVLRELLKSERSWCFMGTSITTTIRMSGTGIRNGKVTCSLEGMNVESVP
jgi:hypothetical protein